MTIVNLKKVEYLGEGYIHCYKDNNGNQVNVPCSKEEYENLNTVPAPLIDGLEFTGVSIGGVVKVNTDDYLIKEGEYCDFEDGYYAVFKDSNGLLFGGKVDKDKIINDQIDNKLE